MQTVYNISHAAAMLGALSDSSFKHTESMIADEIIPVGRAVMRVPGTKDRVRVAQPNYAVLTVSADLIASNSTIITVNGVATAAVVFATSHAATMSALVTAIAGLSTVCRVYLDTTNNRKIHIYTFAAVNVTTGATTAGETQPTWSSVASFDKNDFFGISQLTQRLEGALPNNDNEAAYAKNQLVNVLRRGKIYINFETAYNMEKDTLYVRYGASTGKVLGDFRNDADTAKATALTGLPLRITGSLTAAGINEIELSLP